MSLPAYFKFIDKDDNSIVIEISLLTDPYEGEKLARFMSRVFVTSEPMTIYMKLNEEDFYKEISMYINFAKRDNMIFIAKTVSNDRIIGGIIGSDLAHANKLDPFENLENKQKYQPIFDLLECSKSKFLDLIKDDGHSLNFGMVYNAAFAGLSPRYLSIRNEDGMSFPLWFFRVAEIYGKRKGYRYFYAEATNPGTQKLLHRMGWTVNEILTPFRRHPAFVNMDFKKRAMPEVGNAISGAFLRVGKNLKDLKFK